jgi:hypothetical protein
MAFGAVFMLIPLRMLPLVLTGSQNAARRKQRPASRKAPWKTDHPWKPEGMGPDYAGQAGGSILGRIAFFALIGLFNIAFGSPSILLKFIVVVFDLLGLLILFDSLRALLQAARRVRPSMRWITFPAFTGEWLEGVLTVRPALRVQGSVLATLRCVRDEQGGESSSESVSLEPFAVYEQKLEVPAGGGERRAGAGLRRSAGPSGQSSRSREGDLLAGRLADPDRRAGLRDGLPGAGA